jgi:tripartite motif-containing protein 71
MKRLLCISGLLAILLLSVSGGVQAGSAMPSVHLRLAIETSLQGVTSQDSLAVDTHQNIYVIDQNGPRVLKYNKQGRFVQAWGSKGSGPGQFEFLPSTPDAGPSAGFIAVDSHGNVFVSDAYNFRVQKFDPNGRFLMQFGEVGEGPGQFEPPTVGPIFIDKHDNIWISTFPRVQMFDAKGCFLASYGSAGSGDGQFMGASMGALDHQGNMYIADLFNARVQKLDASGNFVKAWGVPGTEPGQFINPVGIVLDEEGRLYVTDNTNRIQVFTTDGEYLGQWSEPGKGYPPFGFGISGLAIDRKGDIYVADWPTSAIYVFRMKK